MTTIGTIDSSVGPLLVTMSDRGLTNVRFVTDADLPDAGPLTGDVADQLAAYFSGQRREFTLPTDLTGVSGFTRSVLESTARIPYGETVSYGEIARMIGMPGATQAVGNALGANPVPIVIPCHRVIRSDGTMGWFTGGAHIKRVLLRLEGVSFPEQTSLPL